MCSKSNVGFYHSYFVFCNKDIFEEKKSLVIIYILGFYEFIPIQKYVLFSSKTLFIWNYLRLK